MIKRAIGMILAVFPLLAQAQVQIQAPDNDAIEIAVRDAGSIRYYPALMERYQRGDSLLGREEYRHLYYGYMFAPGYDPYTTPPEADSMMMVILHEPGLSRDDYQRLIRYGNKVMETDPFNPRVLNLMTYAYGKTGDAENERRSARRFDGVVSAILSSGEGHLEESPWHILYFSHAEDVLDFLGAEYRQPIVVGWTTEYFPLVKREGRVRGYYFDYSRVYTRRPEQPDDPQPRNWELNGIPLN